MPFTRGYNACHLLHAGFDSDHQERHLVEQGLRAARQSKKNATVDQSRTGILTCTMDHEGKALVTVLLGLPVTTSVVLLTLWCRTQARHHPSLKSGMPCGAAPRRNAPLDSSRATARHQTSWSHVVPALHLVTPRRAARVSGGAALTDRIPAGQHVYYCIIALVLLSSFIIISSIIIITMFVTNVYYQLV